jgi:hypothetical protein
MWPACKPKPETTYRVGRLAFEARTGRLSRLLARDKGVRSGAGFLVGGVQVAEEHVFEAIQRFPFDLEDAAALEHIAQLGWAATEHLYEVSVWLPLSRRELLADLTDGRP